MHSPLLLWLATGQHFRQLFSGAVEMPCVPFCPSRTTLQSSNQGASWQAPGSQSTPVSARMGKGGGVPTVHGALWLGTIAATLGLIGEGPMWPCNMRRKKSGADQQVTYKIITSEKCNH